MSLILSRKTFFKGLQEGAVKEGLLYAHSLGILLIERITNEFLNEKVTITRVRLHTDTLNILKKEIPDDAPDSLMEHLKIRLIDRDNEEKLDRLLQVQIYSLINAYRDDAEIVSNLYDTFWIYLYYTSNLQWAYELGEAAREKTSPEENQDRYQMIIGNQAWILKDWGRLEEAMSLHKKQEEICKKLNNPQSLSICRWNLGVILRDLQRHDEAIAMFENAIALEEKLKSPDLEEDKNISKTIVKAFRNKCSIIFIRMEFIKEL